MNQPRKDLLSGPVLTVNQDGDVGAGNPLSVTAQNRLDGDMYESTIQAPESLYPKVSAGGYLIIDDYGLRG